MKNQEITNITNTDTLYIKMFGGFELFYGTEILKESSNRSLKLWNLLGYLIIYHSRTIPQSEFIDTIWADSIGNNPQSSLKTAFSRLRTFLKPVTPNDDSRIVSTRGSYQWNESLKYHIDTEQFELLCKEGTQKTRSNFERIVSYEKAIDLYKGDFLPRLKDELWIVPLVAYYHSLYIESVKELYELLKEEKLVEKMVDYSTKALTIELYDEKLHCNLIEALIIKGNLPGALLHYQKATEILYNNISVHPSSELNQLYDSIMRSQAELEMDTSLIINNLKEVGSRTGAFFCDYGVFEEIYRLQSRQSIRLKTTNYICVLTLLENNCVPPLNQLSVAMAGLLDSMMHCLRSGDTISKYSGAQYVLLLPFVTDEDAHKVVKRIIDDYYQKQRKSTIYIKYDIAPL